MRKPISHAGVAAAIVAIACSLGASAGAQTRAVGEGSISGFSPKQAMAGQVVTISGMNLDGTRAVMFGTQASHSILVDQTNGNWVRAVVPNDVSPGTVTITLDQNQNPVSISGFQILAGSVNPPESVAWPTTVSGGATTGAGKSATASGTLRLAPRITSFSPTSGPVGTKVTIRGANLGGAMWVKFGGVLGRIGGSSGTTIVAFVPKRGHTGKISVHTRGGTGLSATRYRVVGSSF